jgi:hypothetical protein
MWTGFGELSMKIKTVRPIRLLAWLFLASVSYGQLQVQVQSAPTGNRLNLPPSDTAAVHVYGNDHSTLGFGFLGAQPVSSKVVKGAPYSVEATIESAQTLADGNRIVHRQPVHLYRDSLGRTRREETLTAIGPWAAEGKPATVVTIQDPVLGICYVLDPRQRTATSVSFKAIDQATGANGATNPNPLEEKVLAINGVQITGGPVTSNGMMTPGGAIKSNMGFVVGSNGPGNERQAEPLGQERIAGVIAEGSRTSETIPADTIGNERPLEIVSETWWSSKLQIVLRTKHTDPRLGETSYEVKKLDTGEPPTSLFKVPSNYKVVQMPIPPPFPPSPEQQ